MGVAAENAYLSFAGPDQADNGPYQYGLAGSRATDNSKDLPCLNLQVEIVVNDLAPELGPQPPNTDRRTWSFVELD